MKKNTIAKAEHKRATAEDIERTKNRIYQLAITENDQLDKEVKNLAGLNGQLMVEVVELKDTIRRLTDAALRQSAQWEAERAALVAEVEKLQKVKEAGVEVLKLLTFEEHAYRPSIERLHEAIKATDAG